MEEKQFLDKLRRAKPKPLPTDKFALYDEVLKRLKSWLQTAVEQDLLSVFYDDSSLEDMRLVIERVGAEPVIVQPVEADTPKLYIDTSEKTAALIYLGDNWVLETHKMSRFILAKSVFFSELVELL